MLLYEWLLSGIRISMPLIFAAMGGLLCEKAGIANIALESFLLFSSFSAASAMALTHNLPLSIFIGLLSAVLVGLVFSFFSIKAKADQIIVGTGLNILAFGTIPILCKTLFNVSGQTPSLNIDQRFSGISFFVVSAIFVFCLVWLIFKKLPLGIRIIAAGDNPVALRTQGVRVGWVQFQAIILGSVICGLGGIYLSLGAGSGFTRNMSAGRGYIALTALIFGRWKPGLTLMACLLFGLLDASQIFLQNMEIVKFPSQFIQALPYLFTLIALAAFSSKNFAPKSINSNSSLSN